MVLFFFQVIQVSTPGFCRCAELFPSTCSPSTSCLPLCVSPLIRNISSPLLLALPLRYIFNSQECLTPSSILFFTALITCVAQVVVWHLLQNQLPLSVDLQWALSCLCLALQQPCVWNKLSTPEYNTQTCSLIYCLHHIILAGENLRLCFCKM